jgi:GGDEF domain-containing protein/CheY-like chemotaxis protein
MSNADMNTRSRANPPSPAADDPDRLELPYVLVADTNVERAAICLDSIRRFKAGVLVARDGEEAARILDRFGPPILLIVDLSLARRDGFAVIEGLRAQRRGRTEIIAWAAFRELSEFAAQRLSGLNVRVLRGAAPADVIQTAIERAFERHSKTPSTSDAAPAPSAEELHEIMAGLAEKARHVVRTPGVAVYLRAPGEQFRASVTWTSDSPIPHSPYYMPRVFGWILETGEALVLPDLATQPLTDLPTSTLQDVVRGLVAVPITAPSGQIIGTICVFDLKPLVLSDVDVDALKALGRSVTFGEQPHGDAAAADLAEFPHQQPQAASNSWAAVGEAPAAAAPVPLSRAEAPREPAPEPATPLLDRLNGEFAAARELARARREQRNVSVVLFSVSPGGSTPSGTAVRDDPAALVARTLIKAIRESDLPIRWANDEVLLILPGLGLDDARRVAERVRAALQAGTGHRAAVSAGVAELVSAETFGTLVTRARERVRLALEHGHNRVA